MFSSWRGWGYGIVSFVCNDCIRFPFDGFGCQLVDTAFECDDCQQAMEIFLSHQASHHRIGVNEQIALIMAVPSAFDTTVKVEILIHIQ